MTRRQHRARSASTAASTGEGGGAILTAPVSEAATTAPAVEKMKLRFDASGQLIKQAVYHDDASAIPKAVHELAVVTFPDAKELHYETEHYADLGEVYEVEVETADGKKCEVAGTADGTLLYSECHIDVGELPQPIADAVAGMKILEVEHQDMAEGDDEYTVEVEDKGREFYYRFGPDGALISKHLRVPAIVELPVE